MKRLFLLTLLVLSGSLHAQNERVDALKSRLESVFDTWVLSGGVNPHLGALASAKQATADIDLGEGLTKVDVKIAWKEGRFWGWSSTFTKPTPSNSVFDGALGHFETVYIYHNWAGQKIPLSFSFMSPAIGLLYQQAMEEGAATAAAGLPGPEPALSAVCEPALAVQDDPACASPTVARFVAQLDGLSTLTRTLLIATGEYDHLYTAAFTGCEGIGNVCEGLANASPLKILQGAAQVIVAGRSGMRAYDAFTKHQSKAALSLLENIEGHAIQILTFSDEMGLFLESLEGQLSLVDSKLTALRTWQLQLAENASQRKDGSYAQIMSALESAIVEGEKASAAFTGFKGASEGAKRLWGEVSGLFGEMKSLLETTGDAQAFQARMTEVAQKIARMQECLAKVSQLMEEQDIKTQVVTMHQRAQDEHHAQALQLLAELSRADEARFLACARQLEDARVVLASSADCTKAAQLTNSEISARAAAIAADATQAKREVKRMFTMTDIALGAGVALFVPGGAFVALGAGLATTKCVQLARNQSSDFEAVASCLPTWCRFGGSSAAAAAAAAQPAIEPKGS